MNKDIFVIVEHLKGQVADISYIMLAAARTLAGETGGEVIAVLLGQNAQGLANHLAADKVFYVDHPVLADFTSDAYLATLSALINENQPRAVLLGHTSVGSDVASGLSIRLDLPLIGQCLRIHTEGGTVKFVSQICGGKIMTETNMPETTTLVTVIPGGYKPEEGQSEKSPEVVSVPCPALEDLRVKLAQYIEPDVSDVDISKELVCIGIGRGIQNQDNIELAEELAKAMGGVVCASRPVVDQGWLPTTRLVGKSGKHIKPKLYIAFGISGAPEHIEGITDSETIIAINTDPNAPIFDIAKYGVNIDMFELIEVLTEQVQKAKGG
ncbi:MAG: electron transfer flavoprotein subunit alpha/FixB family protein [Chloroflexota bacterium]